MRTRAPELSSYAGPPINKLHLRMQMNKAHKDKLLKVNKELIEEAKGVIASQFNTGRIGAPTYVDLQILHRWWGKVKSFSHQLGPAVVPWKDSLSTDPKTNSLAFAMSVLGTIEAIQHELENDLFETFTSLVKAETLADLLDQAEHLFGEGYHLAAGVLGRAVLEEHLRTVCSALECCPQKKRPTIADFNQALYGENHYTKVRMKQVDMLAAIGNDAAHNSPSLAAADVKKFLCDLPELLETTAV